MAEEWRDIPGFEGKYQVSDLGRVRSQRKVLKLYRHRDGYLQVKLCIDGLEKTKFVHRLVCEAFHGAPEGREANHDDGDKSNNTKGNLYWTDRSGNMKHAADLGLLKYADNRGERNGQAVLTEALVKKIRSLRGVVTQQQSADMFGVSRRAIGMILSGERWGHVRAD